MDVFKRWLAGLLAWIQRSLAVAAERLEGPRHLGTTGAESDHNSFVENPSLTPTLEVPPAEVEIPDDIILSSDSRQGMLVRFSSESVLDKPIEIPRGARAIAAAGPLVQNALLSSDVIERAIKAKRLVEIVGPPADLAKLDAGMLKFMRAKSDGNFLGSLVDGSNTIRSQARFQPIPAIHLAKVAGIAVFQIASVVTAQIHLADISRKLGSIKASVDEVLSRQQASVYGRVRGAIRRIERLESAQDAGVMSLSRMQVELANINQDVSNSFYECVRNLRDYHDRLPGLRFFLADKSVRVTQLESLPGRPMIDFVTLLGLVDAQSRYYNVLMAAQAAESPDALLYTRCEAENALGEMIEEVHWFADYVELLQKGCRERYRQINDRWFNGREKDVTRSISETKFPALTAARRIPTAPPLDATTRVLLKPNEDGTVEAYLLPVA